MTKQQILYKIVKINNRLDNHEPLSYDCGCCEDGNNVESGRILNEELERLENMLTVKRVKKNDKI